MASERVRAVIHNTLASRDEKGIREHDAGAYRSLPTVEPICSGNFEASGQVSRRISEDQWGKDDASKPRAWALWLVNTVPCQLILVICIILNALVIGMETDSPELPIWDEVETCFLAIFTMELGLRLYGLGTRVFFCGGDDASPISNDRMDRRLSTRRQPYKSENTERAWNIFDFAIVCSGLTTVVLTSFCGEVEHAQNSDATLFRMARLLRLLRLLRIFRVIRFLKQLYLLAYGFMEGAMAVFWVAALAGVAIYMCAVILVRLYGKPDEDSQNYEFFATRLSSVPAAMFLLFEIMSSPSLHSYWEPVSRHPALVVFVIVFILFGSFGMNGLLTGIISESIFDKNQARIEDLREEREAKRRLLEEGSADLFDELDVDEVGFVEHDELMEHREDIAQLFITAGTVFPAHDLGQMFKVVDFHDRGTITRSEFIQCVVGLCEEVRPLSIMEIHSQVQRSLLVIEACHTIVHRLEMSSRWAGVVGDGAHDRTLAQPTAPGTPIEEGGRKGRRARRGALSQAKFASSPPASSAATFKGRGVSCPRDGGVDANSLEGKSAGDVVSQGLASPKVCKSDAEIGPLGPAIDKSGVSAEQTRLQELLNARATSGDLQASCCLAAMGKAQALAKLAASNVEGLCECFRRGSVVDLPSSPPGFKKASGLPGLPMPPEMCGTPQHTGSSSFSAHREKASQDLLLAPPSPGGCTASPAGQSPSREWPKLPEPPGPAGSSAVPLLPGSGDLAQIGDPSGGGPVEGVDAKTSVAIPEALMPMIPEMSAENEARMPMIPEMSAENACSPLNSLTLPLVSSSEASASLAVETAPAAAASADTSMAPVADLAAASLAPVADLVDSLGSARIPLLSPAKANSALQAAHVPLPKDILAAEVGDASTEASAQATPHFHSG